MRILGRYALVLILEGEVYYRDALGRQATLSKDNALLVTPELAHAYGGLNKGVWSQSYVVFDGPQFDLLQQSDRIRSKQPYWELPSVESWNLRLKQLLMESSSNQNGDHALPTLTHFLDILVKLLTIEQPSKQAEDHWLQESTRLLGEPSGNSWPSPQEVASQVGLSYENFRKLFSRQTGLPPAKYQRRRKIDWACAAIYRGTTNFKELADDLEFCDVYHFSKAFRQVKGMPPSAYRRSVRGE